MKDLLSSQEAAEYLGLTIQTLLKLPIPRIQISAGAVRYSSADIQDYIARQTIEAA